MTLTDASMSIIANSIRGPESVTVSGRINDHGSHHDLRCHHKLQAYRHIQGPSMDHEHQILTGGQRI